MHVLFVYILYKKDFQYYLRSVSAVHVVVVSLVVFCYVNFLRIQFDIVAFAFSLFLFLEFFFIVCIMGASLEEKNARAMGDQERK